MIQLYNFICIFCIITALFPCFKYRLAQGAWARQVKKKKRLKAYALSLF